MVENLKVKVTVKADLEHFCHLKRLVRLRLWLLKQDLADCFEISCAIVSSTFTTWINFLYFKCKQIPLWPPQEVIQRNTPNVFKNKYPSTKMILDATEIYVEKQQQLTYYTYKNNIKFKLKFKC